jgi:hypothetical protein
LPRTRSGAPPTIGDRCRGCLAGGNPLAAALAAGETPSPDMVAAAGEPGTLSPAIGASVSRRAGGLLALAPLTRDDVSLIGLTKIELGRRHSPSERTPCCETWATRTPRR